MLFIMKLRYPIFHTSSQKYANKNGSTNIIDCNLGIILSTFNSYTGIYSFLRIDFMTISYEILARQKEQDLSSSHRQSLDLLRIVL